jgi:hypothetical protein
MSSSFGSTTPEDDDDEELLAAHAVSARAHSNLLVNPTFSGGIFVEQLLIQLLAPLSLPFVYALHGRGALVTMRFVPGENGSLRSTLLVSFVMGFFGLQLAVIGLGIVFNLSSNDAPGSDSQRDAFRISLSSELLSMFALAVFQRASVAIKYAYLSRAEYGAVMDGSASLEKMNDDQLLTAWVAIPPRVLNAETAMAAARIGAAIDGVHAHISQQQHGEIMSSLCAQARLTVQRSVQLRGAMTALPVFTELVRGASSRASAGWRRGRGAEPSPGEQSHAADDADDGGSSEGGIDSPRGDPGAASPLPLPAMQRVVARAVAAVDMIVTLGVSRVYEHAVGAWREHNVLRRQHWQRLQRRLHGKAAKGGANEGGASAAAPPSAAAATPSAVPIVAEKNGAASVTVVDGTAFDEDVGGELRLAPSPAAASDSSGGHSESAAGVTAAGFSAATASTSAAAGAAEEEAGAAEEEDDPIGASSGVGDEQSVGVGGGDGGGGGGISGGAGVENDEDLGFLRSPSLRERRPLKISAYDLARAVLADADALLNRKLAPRLFRTLGATSLLLALLPTIVRGSVGIPPLGLTVRDGGCVLIAIYSNANLLGLLLFYLMAGVIDYKRRSLALKKLGDLVRRRYDETEAEKAMAVAVPLTPARLQQWLSRRGGVAPAAAGAQEPATVPSARADGGAALSMSEALSRLKLLPPSLSLDTTGNIRAWLTARRMLQSFGLRFFRRIQLLAGSALLVAAAYAATALLLLLLSSTAGLGLVANVIVAVHAGLLLAAVASLVFVMLNAGARANRQSDEHCALLAARKIEALQAAAVYADPTALAHADAARSARALAAAAAAAAAAAVAATSSGSRAADAVNAGVGAAGADEAGAGAEDAGVLAARLRRHERAVFAERLDAYLGVTADAARWTGVSKMLDGVTEAIDFDRRLEPLTILGVEATEALASSLLATAVSIEAGLAKILNDRFNIQGGLPGTVSGP